MRAEGSIETISPHPLGTLELDGVVVPASRRIGAEGEGFKVAMSVLDVFRSTVGAAANGFARRALDESVAHVKRRQLFGAPLSALQLTQAALATMATDLDAATLLVYRAAWSKDSGRARVTREAAMAKWFATEAAGESATAPCSSSAAAESRAARSSNASTATFARCGSTKEPARSSRS